MSDRDRGAIWLGIFAMSHSGVCEINASLLAAAADVVVAGAVVVAIDATAGAYQMRAQHRSPLDVGF